MKELSNYPLLTADDILNLKGRPTTKKIDSTYNSPVTEKEEWVYYHTDTKTKEHYYFKDGKLVDYKMRKVSYAIS